jgi:hypothetical protein
MNTTHPTMPARLAAATGLLLAAVLLLLAIPSSGMAHGSSSHKAKFGADLSMPGIDAVDAPIPCPLVGSCTRVQSYYEGPPHAGGTPFAPKDGTITKIRLIADSPGKLHLQIAKRGMATESKITREGPTIKYAGTGSVEKFKVDVPVKHYEWLAFKTKQADTLTCEPGASGEDYVYQPALAPGGPFAAAYATEECTQLIGATRKH